MLDCDSRVDAHLEAFQIWDASSQLFDEFWSGSIDGRLDFHQIFIDDKCVAFEDVQVIPDFQLLQRFFVRFDEGNQMIVDIAL